MFINIIGGKLMKKNILLTRIFLLFLASFYFSFQKAEAIDCISASQCTIVGEMLIKQNEFSEAVICLTKSLMMDKEGYVALAYRAKAKVYMKDYDGAFEDISKSLAIFESSLAYGVRARAKLAMNDIQGSIEDSTKAIELNPNSSEFYDLRAIARLKADDYIEALKDSSIAVKNNYKRPENYITRAKAYIGLKDYQSALLDIDIAIKLSEDNKDKNLLKEAEHLKKSCKDCFR